MSEFIDNNRQRRETLKGIIKDIHKQKDTSELKDRFKELLSDVGATEIAQLEQELIKEGLPETEIKSLCDIHVAVFREGLEKQDKPEDQGGHPVHTFKKENKALGEVAKAIYPLLDQIMAAKSEQESKSSLDKWRELHAQLMEVEKHYSRKENILFAYLEKHGISGPPKVMWSIHDDIRAMLKETGRVINKSQLEADELTELIEKITRPALQAVEDMIYKEENILFPMSLETLTEGEWAAIAEQSLEIGYALISPDMGWFPSAAPEPVVPGSFTYHHEETSKEGPRALIPFETGALTAEQISLIFDHLPVDITFVDKDDKVRYFTHGKERIFQRSKAIIGRTVQNCHPPESVHIVNQIVADFRNGKRDAANFWIHMQDMYVYIQYFAVRDKSGEYQGTIEVTQNIQPHRDIQGERRIYSEE